MTLRAYALLKSLIIMLTQNLVNSAPKIYHTIIRHSTDAKRRHISNQFKDRLRNNPPNKLSESVHLASDMISHPKFVFLLFLLQYKQNQLHNQFLNKFPNKNPSSKLNVLLKCLSGIKI